MRGYTDRGRGTGKGREKGSLNRTPAKTGEQRARCRKCGKRKYISDMVPHIRNYDYYNKSVYYTCKGC